MESGFVDKIVCGGVRFGSDHDDVVDPVPAVPSVPSETSVAVELVSTLGLLRWLECFEWSEFFECSGRKWCSYDLYRCFVCDATTLTVAGWRVKLTSELPDRGDGRPDLDDEVAESDERDTVGRSWTVYRSAHALTEVH